MSEVVVRAVVALAVALLTSLGTFWLQRERLRTELRTQFMAEAAACAVTAEGTSLPSERVSLLTEGEGDR